MSTSVDSRVATMKFDNKQFEQGAAQSLSTLGKLKQSLNFKDAAKGLDGLKNVGSKMKLGNAAAEVDTVKNKFSALQVAGVAAIATIASKATMMGLNMAKGFTLDPIKAGFDEYELKMGSIQTILSNTARYGTKLPEVTARLDELNEYADKTIYNFGEMTKNIGLFTNAGIKIGDATSMIKGFSNEAAASGTNAQGAASAAYQLSQALSAGTIRLMDWRSLQNVGMGNKNMQNGLVELADSMGELDKKGVTAKGVMEDFNGSLEKKWLSADVMSNYLKIMAGDMTVAEQKALGLTDAQIKMFKVQQKNAEEAATKVRTFTQLVGTIKESIGSGWSETFGIILGDFNSATKLFTGLNNSIGGAIGKMSDSRNALLKEWSKLGGRTDLIAGIGNVFKALGAILKPIAQAFRDIFPPMTARTLADLTEKFRKFTEGLILSKDSSNDIRSVFKVLFSIVKVGITIIGGIIRYFFEFAKLIGRIIPGVLDVAGAIGELIGGLFGIGDASAGIKGLFDKVISGREKMLGPILDWVNDMLKGLAKLIRSGAGVFIEKVGDAIAWAAPYFKIAADAVHDFAEAVKDAFSQIDFSGFWSDIKALGTDIVEWFKDLFSGLDVGDAFSGLGDSVKKSLGKVDIGSMFSGSAAGAKSQLKGIAGMVDVAPAVEKSKGKIQELVQEMRPLESIGNRLQSLWGHITDAFGEVFTWLKPIGKAIGDAFGWLRDQIKGFTEGLGVQDALAVVNTGFFIAAYMMFTKFTKKMGGVADSLSGMFDNIGGVFGGLTGNLKAMQRDVNATAILKIAGAVAILAGSMYLLSKLKGEEIATGLAAIGGMIIIMVKALGALDMDGSLKETTVKAAQMSLLSASLVALSSSILVMSAAIAILGRMKPEVLKQGLIAVAGTLAIVTIAANVMAKSGGGAAILAASVAIGILAVALTAFAGAIKLYSAIDAGTLAEGGLKIAASLIAVGIAMQFFPPSILLNAAGVIVVAAALIVLAGAIKIMSALDWGTVFKAIGIMVVLFAAIGLSALLLTPVIPVLIGLAAAMTLFGVAAFLVGKATLLFATGLALLAASGTAGVAALTAVILGVAAIFPLVMQQLGLGMRAFAVVIKREGPGVIQALGVVLRELLKEIRKSLPELRRTLRELIKNLLRLIWETSPQWVKTGWKILMDFLRGIKQNARQVAKEGIDTIMNFLQGIRDRMDRIVDSGVKTIISFVNGVAKGIRENKKQISNAAQNLGGAIGEGFIQGLKDIWDKIVGFAKDLAMAAIKAIKDKFDVFSPSRVMRAIGNFVGMGLGLGIKDQTGNVVGSSEAIADAAIDTMKSSVARISSILADDLHTTPTITPVLNLDQLTRDADKMTSLLSGAQPIDASLAFGQATAIAAQRDSAAAAAAAAAPANQEPREIKYEQNIYSPREPSRIDIYRDTKNLLSLAKRGDN